jgi:hypothetical protein
MMPALTFDLIFICILLLLETDFKLRTTVLRILGFEAVDLRPSLDKAGSNRQKTHRNNLFFRARLSFTSSPLLSIAFIINNSDNLSALKEQHNNSFLESPLNVTRAGDEKR